MKQTSTQPQSKDQGGAPPPPPPTSSQQTGQQGGTQRNKRGKTVRAWLNTVGVLLIPIVLALLTYTQHQTDIQIAQDNRQHDIQSEQDRQQYAVLATYLDHMSALIPTLLTSKEGDGVRATAKAQTLATLQQLQLDPERKKIVLLFLYQANLINIPPTQNGKPDKDKEIFVRYSPSAILRLDSADLSNVDLSGVDIHWISLVGVKLTGANLNGTLLYESNLNHVNLEGSHLEDANLNGTNLDSANLRDVKLNKAKVQADLSQANLSGAILSKAKYNNIEIRQVIKGVLIDLSQTRWDLTDKEAQVRGAIPDNTLS